MAASSVVLSPSNISLVFGCTEAEAEAEAVAVAEEDALGAITAWVTPLAEDSVLCGERSEPAVEVEAP